MSIKDNPNVSAFLMCHRISEIGRKSGWTNIYTICILTDQTGNQYRLTLRKYPEYYNKKLAGKFKWWVCYDDFWDWRKNTTLARYITSKEYGYRLCAEHWAKNKQN